MTSCYVCRREFADWPGALSICPGCFAKRPAKLNRKLPARWRPSAESPDVPLSRDEARALLAQADREFRRNPRLSRVTLHYGGREYRVETWTFSNRLYQGTRFIARRYA